MASKKAEVIHRRRLFGGRRTAEEVHRELGLRGRCACGGPPAIRIRVFIRHDDFVKLQPELAAMIAASNRDGPFIPTMESKYGPLVKRSDIVFCDHCRAYAERAAARTPSWAIVEIDRGVGPDKPTVQVPR
jgi:hypothetical protein